jgi:hypothetical protein
MRCWGAYSLYRKWAARDVRWRMCMKTRRTILVQSPYDLERLRMTALNHANSHLTSIKCGLWTAGCFITPAATHLFVLFPTPKLARSYILRIMSIATGNSSELKVSFCLYLKVCNSMVHSLQGMTIFNKKIIDPMVWVCRRTIPTDWAIHEHIWLVKKLPA